MIATIFKNQHFIAVDKPHGWLSVPSRMGKEDPRPCLGKHLEEHLNARIWPIHRLDFEVSGLILFALSSNAHKVANKWFENHTVLKTYEAWTLCPDAEPVIGSTELWKSTLAKGKKRAFEADHGKPAETNANAIGRATYLGKDIVIWHLQPLTGRSHQLRYELYKHKCPVIGDSLYGSDVVLEDNKIALRSIELDFSKCENHGAFELPQRLVAAREHPNQINPQEKT